MHTNVYTGIAVLVMASLASSRPRRGNKYLAAGATRLRPKWRAGCQYNGHGHGRKQAVRLQEMRDAQLGYESAEARKEQSR